MLILLGLAFSAVVGVDVEVVQLRDVFEVVLVGFVGL